MQQEIFIDNSHEERLYEEALNLHNTGKLLESLRVCHRISQTCSGLVKQNTLSFVSNVLLNSISFRLLPIPKSENGILKFGKESISNFDFIMSQMTEIRRLFPIESENILQINARINDLCGAVVDSYLEKGDTQGARSWFKLKNIHNPDLLMKIDMAEISQQNNNYQKSFEMSPYAPILESNNFLPTWGTVTSFSPFQKQKSVVQEKKNSIELKEYKSNQNLIVEEDNNFSIEENIPSIINPPISIKGSIQQKEENSKKCSVHR
eukprot:TRINITY_DN10636_c0_g1_i1.p1 TRINITY_DN10636_c0_g1~~TRINITY_DN10636_c0_g1_i1.p1  ORF type:complete len:264 (-),score=106.74 TRINITY_DN10636_c0_g1_i1:116-907(-)